jgi:hypothetical protein
MENINTTASHNKPVNSSRVYLLIVIPSIKAEALQMLADLILSFPL